MNSPKECPKCGMDKGDVIQGWRCGSVAHWMDGSLQIQSAACAEIERLTGRVEKLETVANECKRFFREKFHNVADIVSALDAMEAPDA